MSRISARFEELARAGDGALIVFVVAGHPDPETNAEVLLAVADGGADLVELGVPFSDPLADGAVIQAAAQRALTKQMTPARVLQAAAAFRAERDLPLVLMTCYNPICQFGLSAFARDAAAAGVDGVIVTDLPPEEAGEWVEVARANQLDTVFLLAPTSPPARVKKVVDLATGFVYCVSRMGVTGARDELPADLADLVGRIRGQTSKPIAVGFGISRPEHTAEVCRVADGAVVGSAVVSLIDREQGSAGLAREVRNFVNQLKRATRGAQGVDGRR
ncbi:MAG: tryptophan synthase subunit alpha [Armatimonadota bacterium]|nr:MAG: tryptophan synthase subunit alpha [Armatimonadota bacterium]